MNLINLYIFITTVLKPTIVDSVRFTTVTNSPIEFLYKFWREEHNKGTQTRCSSISIFSNVFVVFVVTEIPTVWIPDPPSKLDSSTKDSLTRLRLCEDLSNNGVFKVLGYNAPDMKSTDLYTKLEQPENWRIFYDLYTRNSSDKYEYTNSFSLQKFAFLIDIIDGLHTIQVPLDIEEYVFVCLFEEQNSKNVIPFYVSKAYNLLHDRRFLFLNHNVPLMLAEKSAEAYINQNFNVELHYLELRKHHEPGNS